ncbi:MAG: phosphotransferase [Actinobacteria bacterium]|nr:phosphotransferase [Actinomycetota bacterium]
MTAAPGPEDEDPASLIAALLASRYGLAPSEVSQVPVGQGTVNYRAACQDRDVFVKSYPPGTDLAAEREAIALTALAGRAGVPVAPLIPARDGQPITRNAGAAVSVWQWMPGAIITARPGTRQLEQAGAALGRIHAAFAPLPASSAPAPQVTAWRSPDIAALNTTIGTLLAAVTDRAAAGQVSSFDRQARSTLTERQDMLTAVPGLLAALPELTAQVLHGDYSPVNLLWDDGTLTAVLDFRPPDPFLTAYDLGRIAFYPNTVTSDPGWLRSAQTLAAAYIDANPAARPDDIRWCARVALLQLVTSLYGVKQHYLKPGLFQDDLDQFWLLRHQAAGILLAGLADAEAMLAALADRLPSGKER